MYISTEGLCVTFIWIKRRLQTFKCTLCMSSIKKSSFINEYAEAFCTTSWHMLDGGLDSLILKLKLGERLLFYNIKTNNKWKFKIVLFFMYLLVLIRRGVNKFLARPTSPCRRNGIDSVVGKRGLFMCRIASLFLLQGWKEAYQATRAIPTTLGRELSSIFFFPESKAPK